MCISVVLRQTPKLEDKLAIKLKSDGASSSQASDVSLSGPHSVLLLRYSFRTSALVEAT